MSSTTEPLHWKEQPCHFTWNLSAGDLTDYEGIIRKIDHDLKMTPNLLRVDQLLFRAYLEVSDRRLCWNVKKAREFLDEADDYIDTKTERKLQPGYRRVAILNRIWIEHNSHNTKEVDKLLSKLSGLGQDETDELVVKTLLASALTRLGPTMLNRSLQIYEEALHVFPDNAGFLYGAILVTGRIMRFERPVGSLYKDLDKNGMKLMDKEKKHCDELIRVNDEYQYGKSYLGLNLSRRADEAKKHQDEAKKHQDEAKKHQDEAKKHLEEAKKHLEEAHEKAPEVEAVFNNLMRFYRCTKGFLDQAISKYESVFSQKIKSNHDVPESHNQLALCYMAKAKYKKSSAEEKKQYTQKALEEFDKCLKDEPMHFVAALKKVELLAAQETDDDAKRRCYEDILQKSDKYPISNKLTVYLAYSKAGLSLDFNMLQKVMDLLSSFEHHWNEKKCKWEFQVRKAKDASAIAFKKLHSHYLGQENEKLRLGILYFQNLDFEEAIRNLEKLNPESDLDIPFYLAAAYLKWGSEKEMSKKPAEDVRDCYKKARRNVYDARKQGLDLSRFRKLLSDAALAIAHFNLETNTSQQSRIEVESDCIESYREAIRCGSLVASLEMLRLIKKGFLKKTPRAKFLQILAEIDICCSQRRSDCLHRDEKPRSFVSSVNSQDTDKDAFELDCKKIKQSISTTLREDAFFRQAWVQHFEMEKKVLEERFQNNHGELALDGREESSTKSDSTEEEIDAAINCCEKLRPLLDHIINKFEKDELKKTEETWFKYFPLISTKKDSVRTDLQETLQKYFGINFKEHYPKLFESLVQVQPGFNSDNAFLLTLNKLVNHVKHSGTHTQDILEKFKKPVKLARQCIDKVEEICNFFFKAMKESSELGEKKNRLVTDLKHSGQELGEKKNKADELLRILQDHNDFVVRMSTTDFLELLAVIKMQSDREEAVNKLAKGTWELSENLRTSHLELEVSIQNNDRSKKEVIEKCRDTCKEADTLLKEVLKTKRQDDGAEVQFPFVDMHSSDLKDWKRGVQNHLKKDMKSHKINPTGDLLKVMLQAQPCSSEENYNFLLMRKFLEKCDGAGDCIPSEVSIRTESNELKSHHAVDLTRWCTNNAEKIASEVLSTA
ncbi:uncharacterized protein [Asterias amurensis]|uniref:uncharacterized protein n=1 Tax=Asterias amurensis TaxID=7602 RepID=UPI003AB4C9CD